MIPVPQMKGKTVAVMGLGKSGTATAKALQASGATVWVWDDKDEARQQAARDGLTVVDLYKADFSGIDSLLWSPGIAHTHPKPHPVAEAARAAGVELICDIELLARAQRGATFLGVTGTNGKSTTTTLLAHVLKEAGRRVEVGGNLGTPALALAPVDEMGAYVLELSSYQVELIDRAGFDVAILLNITPDHLARHGGMDGYVAAKAKLFSHLKPGSFAIVSFDDEHCRAIAKGCRDSGEMVLGISVEKPVDNGVYAVDGVLVDALDGDPVEVLDLKTVPTLPGKHNWQNACAVYAAARAFGEEPEDLVRGLKSYPGLAHRQQLVATVDGIRFVNDSKATNADAAEKALVCYDDIYWIAGGQAKEGGIESLKPQFPRIRHAFLIGEAASQFADTLGTDVPFSQCGTLDIAVQKAAQMATPGSVVLLSPACASWDQFKSFEHRGEVFAELVAGLPGQRG